MPELNIDSEGFLLDAEGNRFEMDGEPVKVPNAVSKSDTERIIKERLARQADKVKELEQHAMKVPELQQLLQAEKTRLAEIEKQALLAKEEAEKAVESQIAKAREEATKFKSQWETEREARVRDQVTTMILANAGDVFVNPALDIVPKLLQSHKREPKKDDRGQAVDGEFVDVFDVSYKDDKGNTVRELLPVDKALQVIAAQPEYQHYVRGARAGGSGGGQYVNHAGLKRSSMSPQERVEFIGKHGQDKYLALPWD